MVEMKDRGFTEGRLFGVCEDESVLFESFVPVFKSSGNKEILLFVKKWCK